MDYTPIKFESRQEREDYLRTHYTPILGELGVGGLISSGFLIAPASTKYHGAYEGGLFDHSVNVAEILHSLSHDNNLKWKNGSIDRSPWIIGILHDLCKTDQYKPILNETGDVIPGRYEWNNNPIVKGHGMKSVIYAQAMAIRLSEEERACIIYHMGAFTPQEEWRDYTHAVNMYSNVLWTHHADMIASHIMEV